MALFTRLPSDLWRVHVCRNGRYVSETFLPRDARLWAIGAERKIDHCETPCESRISRLKTLSELIDLYIDDMCYLADA